MKNKLNYLGLSLLNKVMAAMARGLRNEPSIMAASKMNVDAVNLDSVKLANKILQAGLENITNIVTGAKTMEVCVLYSNSIFHKRQLAKQQKYIINLNDYEDDEASVSGGRKTAPPLDEEDDPPKKVPRKKYGNVGPLLYAVMELFLSPSLPSITRGGKRCATPY